MTSDLIPFTLAVPEPAVGDLDERLRGTRWPSLRADDDRFGQRDKIVRDLVDYWQSNFDWRAQEAAINRLPAYRIAIDGYLFHFLHFRRPGSRRTILLLNGWPSTFLELVPLAERLAKAAVDPSDAFDVVVPSLPGFAFSDARLRGGRGYVGIAETLLRLMRALGYVRYVIHGSDWGAEIASRMAFDAPGEVAAIHICYAISPQPDLSPRARPLSRAERVYLDECQAWDRAERGYGHIQDTKPQTLSFSLAGSPAGLLAWQLEKFTSWSDCGGEVTRRFSADWLLTNASIYWFTGTASSASRVYFESARNPWRLVGRQRVNVPTWLAQFADGDPRPPDEYVRRSFLLAGVSEHVRGGHFPAHEEPELLAQDIRSFIQSVRVDARARPVSTALNPGTSPPV